MATATTKVRCPKCNGFGEIEVDDAERPCEAEIVIGSEDSIGCFASRQHPGWPHMAILAEPCAACGGFEEHDDSCVVYPADEVRSERIYVSTWWYWTDGDLTVSRDLARLGQVWRDTFQPDSPYARGGKWYRGAA